MNALLKQIQRWYEDNKYFDFTDKQVALAEAQMRLTSAAKELIKSAHRLDTAAADSCEQVKAKLN